MSAFVFAEPHIRALTNYAFAHGDEELMSFADHIRPGETARDTFGRLLLEENVRSVSALYGDRCGGKLVGPEPIVFTAGLNGVALHDPLTILQACQCYEYQASDTDDYGASWAAAAIGRIRRTACAEVLRDMRLPDWMSGWPVRTDAPDPAGGLAPRYHPRQVPVRTLA